MNPSHMRLPEIQVAPLGRFRADVAAALALTGCCSRQNARLFPRSENTTLPEKYRADQLFGSLLTILRFAELYLSNRCGLYRKGCDMIVLSKRSRCCLGLSVVAAFGSLDSHLASFAERLIKVKTLRSLTRSATPGLRPEWMPGKLVGLRIRRLNLSRSKKGC